MSATGSDMERSIAASIAEATSESRMFTVEHGGNKDNSTRRHWPHYVTGEASAVLRVLADLIQSGRAVGSVQITEDDGYHYATGLYR